ncbi:hypothetical protein HPB48_026953 [Haemaphysalis longicornis]|uniref:Uncharacterized protein n=1 Tax=Haemaphysalis longicornis TaxID=44386 RepID=A0A9J6HAZ7_HAELO|nr:hypothetical protein HPB48_026953 [Haemaphysalis longicornis]
MRMTHAEQHELLREIIRWQTTPSTPPLRVFFTGPAGCGKTFVLRLGMARTPPTTRSPSARCERRLWKWGEPRFTRLSSSLGRPSAITRTEASSPVS